MPLNPAGVPSMAAIQAAIDEAQPRNGTWSGDVAPGITSRSVSFTPPFPTGVTPRVALGLHDVNLDWITTSAASITNSGCQIQIRNGFSGDLYASVDYIAVAP